MSARHAPLAAGLALVLLAAPAAGADREAALLNEQGNQLYREGRHEEALAHYSEALAAAPDSPALRFNLANALFRLGRVEEAAREYARASSLAQSATDLEQNARFNEGTAFLNSGRFADAARRLREVVLESPDDDEARRNLELALARLEQQPQDQQQKQDAADDRPQQEDQKEGAERRGGEQDRSQRQEGKSGEQGEPRPQPQDGQSPGEPPPQGRGSQGGEEPPQGTAPRPATPAEDLTGEEARRLLEALSQDERGALKEVLQRPAAQKGRSARDW